MDFTFNHVKTGTDNDLKILIDVLNISNLEGLLQWKLESWVEKRVQRSPEELRPKNVAKMGDKRKMALALREWARRDKQRGMQ